MKSKLILCLALILSGGVFGCSTTVKHASGLRLRYHNAQYNFTFFLPANWKEYSVLVQNWESRTYLAATDETEVTGRGSMIVLRHPQWKASDPYQDIPIVVFTRSQWDSLHHGNLWPSIYAGGIMDEMWHNRKYVFGINSRYNWGELTGSKEVAEIVWKNLAANAAPELHPK